MPTKKSRAEYMRNRRKNQKEETEKKISTDVAIVEKKSVLPRDENWGKVADKPPIYHKHRAHIYPMETHKIYLASFNTDEDEDDYEEEEKHFPPQLPPPQKNFIVSQLPPPPKLIAPPPTYVIGQSFSCKKCGHFQPAGNIEKCISCHAPYIFDADRSHALPELDAKKGQLIVCGYCRKPHQEGVVCLAKKRAMRMQGLG